MLLPGFVVNAQISDWKDCGVANPDPNCCIVDGVPTLKCLEVVFGNILYISTALIILVLFIMFIVGSVSYLASMGNPEKVKKARGTLTYAIVGFVLFISAYLILRIIDVLFLGGTGRIFHFSIP